jgi:uncharacterized membrane protein YwaF
MNGEVSKKVGKRVWFWSFGTSFHQILQVDFPVHFNNITEILYFYLQNQNKNGNLVL